jgi:hypothetical protein
MNGSIEIEFKLNKQKSGSVKIGESQELSKTTMFASIFIKTVNFSAD